MKRKLFAVTMGVVAMVAVALAFSPFLGGSGLTRAIVAGVATIPLSIPAGFLLERAGVAVELKAIIAIAFVNWLLLGYWAGGIWFRDAVDTRIAP